MILQLILDLLKELLTWPNYCSYIPNRQQDLIAARALCKIPAGALPAGAGRPAICHQALRKWDASTICVKMLKF